MYGCFSINAIKNQRDLLQRNLLIDFKVDFQYG